MKMVLSSSSQSGMGDIKLENWSISSIISSLSVTYLIGYWVNGSFSSAIMISITSFPDDSDETFFSTWLSGFFLKLYLFPIFPKKHLMWSILTNISLPDLIGSHWKHVVVAFIVVKFFCVVVSFVGLLYWCLGLEFVAAIVCEIAQKLGSSALVAQACLLHGFNLSDT